MSNLPLGISTIEAKLNQNNEIIIIGSNLALEIDDDDTQNILITKIDSTGTLDTLFGNNGLIELTYDYQNFYPVAASIKDQDVYILFDNLFGDGYISKYNLDSMEYDNSFGTNGILELANFPQDETYQAFTIDAANNLFITGAVPTGNNLEFELFIYKYGNTGTLDSSFGTNGIVNFQLIDNSNSITDSHKIDLYNDKILIMGTSYNWDAERGCILNSV